MFCIDEVPRYGITWAFLSGAAQQKLMRGEMLTPAEWRSGNNMWVIEIIAPYAQGTAAAAVHWLKRNVPDTIDVVRCIRTNADTSVNRVIEVKRIKGAQWGTRLVPVPGPDNIDKTA